MCVCVCVCMRVSECEGRDNGRDDDPESNGKFVIVLSVG